MNYSKLDDTWIPLSLFWVLFNFPCSLWINTCQKSATSCYTVPTNVMVMINKFYAVYRQDKLRKSKLPNVWFLSLCVCL